MSDNNKTATQTGSIVQIIGAVVDCVFPSEHVPKVYDALNLSLIHI